VAPRNSQLPKWSLHSLMYTCTFIFLQNFQKICGYSSAWPPVLPHGIFRIVASPLNLYHSQWICFEHLDFPVQDAHWLHQKIPFMLHLDHSPINYMVRIRYIFLIKKHETHYEFSWMQVMQACMQLGLSSLNFK
jgi:hypothetical protein